ncbi:MAG: OmpA family protein [Flavobacteriales bacterium]|nr:OmpA family protein [Flavobacteriales bacterium]MCW8912959.1 OmpA family protein [Flavobacteriales bacterium]MCW8938761.1 OmpA family protein [Flavobacteriales bacterium]MCW8969025.1 OmpA family protein [Flavobacteriales bacterium]MCW8988960.1 OmpA family protein [Flavobacteriales bacterium]
MKIKISLRLLTILILLTSMSVFGQTEEVNSLSKKEAKQLVELAEQDFEERNYLDALDKFSQLHEYDKKDIYYKMMTGICATFDPNQKEISVKLLEEVKQEKPEYGIINFYLGKAYAVNYDFDKSIQHFNFYLASAPADEAELIRDANQMMKNAQNAKEILADTIHENIVENIGYPINSQYSEYVPVISADESVMIFTYRGVKSVGADKVPQSMSSTPYFEDVFISYKKNGEWTEPISIGANINTEGHDAAIGLSVDGQTLFIYKSENNNYGDIYVSQLEGNDWTKPKKLQGEVNKNDSWEGSASLSANGKTLYFSSDRKGGMGGRDLYKAELQADGSWGNVQNLGGMINTIYNDDAPFIHPDGRTLYFASEGHTSIGGYDIFSSVLDEYGAFTEPKNMGYPINTIDDNRYFVLSADGNTGYYSGGGVESMGEQDIFKITTGRIEKPVLALLLGNVYFNDIPTGSFMNLYKSTDGELEGIFKSNEETGKYVMALAPGRYEIEVELESGEIVRDSIRLDEITEYVEIYKDFRIYSDSALIVNNNKALADALAEALKKENKTVDTLYTDDIKSAKDLTAGKTFVLNNIFYDFDKASLRTESKVELDKLVGLFKEYPELKVEISAHTDARGSNDYNQRLSQRRANSVVNYLVAKGIKKNRFVASGKGETEPYEDCSKYTECGETRNDECPCYQKNRRTEFKVLGN